MKLHTFAVSGNAWKVRLLLSMLKVPFEAVMIDMKQGGHKKPEFLKINPRGQVPVIEDDGHVIWDSTACLVYIARKHGGEQWLPTDAAGMAEVQQWLAFSNNEIHYGLQWARARKLGIRAAGSYDEYAGYGRAGLAILEAHLQSKEWLALGRPTVADIACYPYVAVAHEGDIDIKPYPSVLAWSRRIEALPGWVRREMA